MILIPSHFLNHFFYNLGIFYILFTHLLVLCASFWEFVDLLVWKIVLFANQTYFCFGARRSGAHHDFSNEFSHGVIKIYMFIFPILLIGLGCYNLALLIIFSLTYFVIYQEIYLPSRHVILDQNPKFTKNDTKYKDIIPIVMTFQEIEGIYVIPLFWNEE